MTARRSGPVRSAAGWLVGLGARLHRRFGGARRGERGQPSCAVLSVGGLTIGGAGKTPVAARLAIGLAARGHRVVLASRGYKGRSQEPVLVVSDGTRVLSSVAEAGDEAMLLAGFAPGVPMLVGRDRRRVGLAAVARFGCEVLVLDDGFQHHRLERDVDLVCIDADAGLGSGQVFPAGPLRESASALAQADWVCVLGTGAAIGETPFDREGTAQSEAAVRAMVGDAAQLPAQWVHARRVIQGVRIHPGEGREDAAALAGRSFGLIAGVGRPGSVRRSAESLGARIEAERLFADHHVYRPRDLAGLAAESADWLTTEKDALKILPEWPGDATLHVLELGIEIQDETHFLDRLEKALFARRASHAENA